MLTALSVARDCSIVDPGSKVIFPQVYPPSRGREAHIQWCHAEEMNKEIPTEEVICETLDRVTSLDRLHFALTGHSWEMIRKYFPDLMSRLVVYGSVFARMSPEQKQQLVEELQELG